MSVKKDESGRRSIEASIEVPCTPEELWETVTTGAGMAAWFMPMQAPEGVGDVVVDMGEGPVKIGEITTWDPPHGTKGEGYMFPGGPLVATEWTIEARAGGKSIVRVVNSLFASTDEWDDQLGSLEMGWPRFFRILRMYVERFHRLAAAPVSAMRPVALSRPEAWGALTAALGVDGKSAGDAWSMSTESAPEISGVIEESFAADPPRGLIRIDQPVPGAVAPFAVETGGQVVTQLNLYLYGDEAGAVAARDAPRWQAWIDSLPMPGAGAAEGST